MAERFRFTDGQIARLEKLWKEHGVARTASMLGSSVETVDKAASSVGVRREVLARLVEALDAQAPAS